MRVLEFNEDSKKFLVLILKTNKKKWVNRLSLWFDFEDPIKFKERLKICEQRLKRAEDEYKFFKYVENLPNYVSSNFDKKVIYNQTLKKL